MNVYEERAAQLARRATNIVDTQRKLFTTALLEIFITDYMDPDGPTNAMRQFLGQANSTYSEVSALPSVLPKLNPKQQKLLEATAAAADTAERPVIRRRGKAVKGQQSRTVADHRNTKEWRKDLLLYAAAHQGILDIGLYRTEEMPKIYPEGTLASKTRLNAATNWIKNLKLTKMKEAGLYRLTALGEKEAGSYGETYGHKGQKGQQLNGSLARTPISKKKEVVEEEEVDEEADEKLRTSSGMDRLTTFASAHHGVLSVIEYRKHLGGRNLNGYEFRLLNDQKVFLRMGNGVYALKKAAPTKAAVKQAVEKAAVMAQGGLVKDSKDGQTAEAIMEFAANDEHGEFALDAYYPEHKRVFGVDPAERPQIRGRIIRVVNKMVRAQKLRRTEPGHFELKHMPEKKESAKAATA